MKETTQAWPLALDGTTASASSSWKAPPWLQAKFWMKDTVAQVLHCRE